MRGELLKLLVYEYVSGGGFAGESLPASVLSEGFGMLRTVILDFKAAGYNVITTLDSRIARFNPLLSADCIVPITSSCDIQAKLRELFEQVEAAYIVAPESGGVLHSLVETVEQMGIASLNCRADAIKKMSDKAVFHEFVRALGLHLPKTGFFSVNDDLAEIKKVVRESLRFPLVFKPSDGVSCSGLSVVQNETQIASAVDKIRMNSSSKHFLIQELIRGAAASVTLLSTCNSAIPISLNRQDVKLEKPSSCSYYKGGVVPFVHPLEAEAFKVAQKLAESIPSLRGYFGVDFVLTKDLAVILEVNPRLTTSYVGLRRVVNFNPAQAIIDSVLKNRLPSQVKTYGSTYFSKIETPIPTVDELQDIYGMHEVVSPPFPVSEGAASSLIASNGDTLQEAVVNFRETKKRVLDTMSGGSQ